MPEHPDQISALDFLQSSELTARLRRRLVSSPGVINIQGIFKIYARLTEWTPHTRLLRDELLARYSAGVGSTSQNLPLVTEHPWMLNLDTYLTNSNSFSSTTNNSYSVTTNKFVSQTLSSLSPPSRSTPEGLGIESVSKHELIREMKATQLESKSSARSGNFRVSRKPGRMTPETAASVARHIQNNRISDPAPALTYASSRLPPGHQKKDEEAGATTRDSADLPLAAGGDQRSSVQREVAVTRPLQTSTQKEPAVAARSTTKEELQTAAAKNAASTVATLADLPLASRTRAPKPDQRELSEPDLNIRPAVSKDPEDKPRPGDQEPPSSQSIFAPLNQQAEITNLSLGKIPRVPQQPTDPSWPAPVQEQRVSAALRKQQPDLLLPANADHRSAATPSRSLPTAVNEGGASLPTGQRPTDFVWLRNRTERIARELMVAVSDISSRQTGPRAAREISTTHSAPHNHLVTPESARRIDRPEEGVEITAEKILRRISHTLLVERERRGY
jgi:hypothetical protein